MSLPTRVRSPFARRPLTLELLERRDTPSFSIINEHFGPGTVWFVTFDTDQHLALDQTPDGYLRHNLFGQPGLESDTDLSAATPGVQQVLVADLTLVDVSMKFGTNDLTVNYGGPPVTRFFGGDANDTATAGAGPMEFRGGPGRNTFNGGAGDDTVVLESFDGVPIGTDVWHGGGGTNKFVGPGIHDLRFTPTTVAVNGVLSTYTGFTDGLLIAPFAGGSVQDASGLTGPVYIEGSTGPDLLIGGSGNDTIRGHDGDDTLAGGAGNDSIEAGLGADSYTGGTGTDTLTDDAVSRFRLTNTQIVVDGRTISNQGFERVTVTGTAGDDTLDASAFTRGPVRFVGLEGVNVLRGGSGDDQLENIGDGTGRSVMTGGAGSDYLIADGASQPQGGAGDDVILAFFPGATVTGGDGNDYLSEYADGQLALGGAGNDRLFGFGVGSAVFGEGGNDTLYGSPGVPLDGGLGDDTLSGSDAVLHGGPGNDRIESGAGVVAYGDDGNDVLLHGFVDTLYGGAGNDTISVGPNGLAFGGAGIDRLILDGPISQSLVLTDTTLVENGYPRWTDHGFESADVNYTFGFPDGQGGTVGVQVDVSGFTRGPVTVLTPDGDDTITVGPNATAVNGGSGRDVLVVRGTAAADAFAVTGSAAAFQVRVNAKTLVATGVEELRLDGLAGANTIQVTDPFSVPLYAYGFAPVVSAGPNAVLPTGSLARAGTFTDPGLNTGFTATVDYGDGSAVEVLHLYYGSGQYQYGFDLAHTYTRRGNYTVRVTVTDGEGNVGIDTFRVRVAGL